MFSIIQINIFLGNKGDTCVQCEGSREPGLQGPPGPKGEQGE